MHQLSPEGRRLLGDLAQRHGFSSGAVEQLFFAVLAGQGNQAQFNHPDFGGMGQWSRGGMIMIGDMFNNALKARVDGLCYELSNLLSNSPDLLAPQQSFQSQSQGSGVSFFAPGFQSSGWPAELGLPASSGSQNNLRYAFFPATRRLALDVNGAITVYDTGDHAIGGFSQQQSGDQSLSFTSQYGLVRLSDLPVVGAPSPAAQPMQAEAFVQPQPVEPIFQPAPAEPALTQPSWQPVPEMPTPPAAPQQQPATRPAAGSEDIFDKLERLAALHGKGILTPEEFAAAKAELLSRL